MNQLLLATTNPGKIAELRALLRDLPIALLTPAEAGIVLQVDEDGDTFLANARKKAEAGVRLSGLPTLADDSGLEVPVLDGRPGIHSARFAGQGADGDALVRRLLAELGPRAASAPAASFRCAAIVLLPDGRRYEAEGILQGTIAAAPRGEGGFGYDPIFVLADGRHLAELGIEDKNLLSHRARALTALDVQGAFEAALRC